MTDRFYSYDPEDGYSEHDSEEAAEQAAERALSGYCGDADEHGWPDGVEAIHWGRLLVLGSSQESHGTSDGEPWVDYHLATEPDELAQLRARVATLQADLESARAVVGEAWFAGGATLAEAITRKTKRLEELVAQSTGRPCRTPSSPRP
jgi:hypothetical protein